MTTVELEPIALTEHGQRYRVSYAARPWSRVGGIPSSMPAAPCLREASPAASRYGVRANKAATRNSTSNAAPSSRSGRRPRKAYGSSLASVVAFRRRRPNWRSLSLRSAAAGQIAVTSRVTYSQTRGQFLAIPASSMIDHSRAVWALLTAALAAAVSSQLQSW